MFTLEEQLHKATALLMNLPRRECVIKLESQAPYLTRTPDLTPAFKSEEFKAEILPRYMETIARRSPYLIPAEKVDAEHRRTRQRARSPSPTTRTRLRRTRANTNHLGPVAAAYARDFHKRRGKSKTCASQTGHDQA